MSRTSKLDVLGIIGCTFGFVTVKALRWGCLVRHIQPMSLRQLIGPTLAGIAVNYGVPHSGEFVRTWMVAHRENLPKAALLASIAVERIFDFCAVLLLGLVALLAAREVIDTLRAYLWVSLAFIGVASGITMSFVFWAARALDISRRLLEPLPVSACSWILRNLRVWDKRSPFAAAGSHSDKGARTIGRAVGAYGRLRLVEPTCDRYRSRSCNGLGHPATSSNRFDSSRRPRSGRNYPDRLPSRGDTVRA